MRTVLLAIVLLAFGGCSREGRVERVEWTVMGTVAAVQWKGEAPAEPLVPPVKEVFARIEKLLNAHDSGSELSRLAKEDDATVLATCDPSVRPCYEMAFRLRDETGGLFNPRWKGPGTMDLGAIAKGYAVDCAAEKIRSSVGTTSVLVDLGGNLKAVSGTWSTGIYRPLEDGTEMFSLAATSACATSGEYFRGAHIRDGRDGSEVTNRIYSVTVIHPTSAMLADGLSTVMFLMGRERGERFLRERHPEAKAIWMN